MKLFFIFELILFIVSLILLIKIKLVKISKQKQLKEKKELETDIQNLQQQKKNLDQNLNEIVKSINQKDIELTNLKDYTKNQQETVKKLLENNQKLRQTNRHTEQHYLNLLSKTNQMQQKIDVYYEQQKQKVDNRLKEFKQLSSKAAEYYFDTLQEAYKTADAAHAEKMTRLKEEQDSAAAALNNLKETRKAAYEAILKEKQVKEKSTFYTVQLDKKCLHDISLLNSISSQLIDSRPLNMVIWTSYYSKKVNELCSRIIGTEIKSGIYKITFLPTNQCYIGQAKDLKERIRTHIKAGSCHIDTPSNNKLYEKMGKNSIQNFTFQILEYCSIEKLNQKEKYYIDLYQSYDYGFNSNRGISK